MAPSAWEGKRYKLVASENFDEFLKEIGVNYILRKIINATKPTIELIKDGDQHYVLKSSSTFRSIEYPFAPEVEFQEAKPNGAVLQTVYRFEDENRLFQRQWDDKINVTILREFSETESVWTIKVRDIICVRRYVVQS